MFNGIKRVHFNFSGSYMLTQATDTLLTLPGTNSLLLKNMGSVTADRAGCFAGNRHHHRTFDVRYAGHRVNESIFSITVSVLPLLNLGF